jgi:acyl-coenzyme A synthetase/AMP-(fatty) acid ligase
VDSFPLTASGKIQKYLLREIGAKQMMNDTGGRGLISAEF